MKSKESIPKKTTIEIKFTDSDGDSASMTLPFYTWKSMYNDLKNDGFDNDKIRKQISQSIGYDIESFLYKIDLFSGKVY